jgi:hypothetical protein
MSITRRAFLSRLAVAAFGVSNATDFVSMIQDAGRPILLSPARAEQTLHVYEGGIVALGSMEAYDSNVRPTWREIFAVEGEPVHDPERLQDILEARWMTLEELDEPICDVCWPMAEAVTWNPTARAYRLLRHLKVGTCLRGREGRLGRLTFREGDNHPGSSDMWVEARDDLSVSLLQARLIELGQPIRVVMETATVQPLS